MIQFSIPFIDVFCKNIMNKVFKNKFKIINTMKKYLLKRKSKFNLMLLGLKIFMIFRKKESELAKEKLSSILIVSSISCKLIAVRNFLFNP